MKEFFYKKMDVILDQLIKSYGLPPKKKSICLSSKVAFFVVGFSTAIPSAKNRMINSAEIMNINM